MSIGNSQPQSERRQAVLFDLDGTLIDSIDLILESMRYAFAKRARPTPSDAEWLTGVGTPLRVMFQRYANDEADIDDFVAAYREHQLSHHDALVRCYDDVPATLAALTSRGHRLGVVTSKTEALARRGLEHTAISQYFEVVVGCDSCQRHKPHPEPVLMALDRLGYAPREAVFVGDSVHDIEAGNAAGVLTIAALWGPFVRKQLAAASPGRFIERIGELLQLLTER